MITVHVPNYGDFDSALRAFNRKVRKAQIIEICHKKSHYISPSQKRHRAKLKWRKKIMSDS
ncbi:MAG: 30S ribosomal protein S21 [Caldisericaceae bacterium]|nr:30S ribosomal protein S21 [Caldisericaceae bacterium]